MKMVKKLIVLTAVLLMLVSGSVMICESYAKAESLAKEESLISRQHEVANEFYNNTSLRTLPYALKAEMFADQEAYDVLLDVNCDDAVLTQRIKSVFGNYYGYWKSHIYEYVNVHTFVQDKNSKRISGTHPELADLSLEELTQKYQIVLKLNYDSTGNLNMDAHDLVGYSWISQFNEEMKAEIERYMRVEVQEYATDGYAEGKTFHLSLKPISDTEMIIAVPYELEIGDSLYYAGQVYEGYIFERYLSVYAALVCTAVFALSLFLPLSVYKEVSWLKHLLDIKIEILAVLLFFSLLAGFPIFVSVAQLTVDGSIMEVIQEFQLENWLNELTGLLNVGIWFAYLAAVMFAAMLIRWIWHKGLIRYLKENTCIAWFIGLLMALVHWIVKLFDRLMSFDLKDSANQMVIKIVGINMLVTVLLCCIFPAGILFAVIYSFAAFFFLRGKLRKIQADYSNVLETAERLSDGNFNVLIHQDAGAFSSMNDALATLKTGFQKAVNEEVKSQRMKSELITNVSHDLKTPLTSIITYVDLLKNSQDDEEKKQYIETIDRNSQRLKTLIEDLFEVSKATSGNISLNLVDVDLVSLVRQVHLECEEKLQEKNLEVRIQSSHEKIILKLDSAKAFRIFENLILNICKYAMSSTRVFISIEQNESRAKVIFKNISEQEISFDPEEITERFVQGDKSRNVQGSGLGLAIVKSFTELHHGSFHIETDGDLFKAIVQLPMNQ